MSTDNMHQCDLCGELTDHGALICDTCREMNRMEIKLALRLANLAADELATKYRTKASQIAAARYLGACEVAHIMGYGTTPTHVDLDVRDWVRENPRPVDTSAYRKDIKAWWAKAETEVTSVLRRIFTQAGVR
jgi:hypothetical protein